METVLKWTFVMTFVLLDYALWLTYFKSFVPFHVERLARSIVFGLLIQARPCTPSWFFGKWHLRRCLSASNWTFEDLSSTGEEKYSVSGFLENRRTRIDVTTNCCFIDITKNAVSKTQFSKDKALQYQLIGYWFHIKRSVLFKGLIPFAIKRNFHSSRHFCGVIFHSGTLWEADGVSCCYNLYVCVITHGMFL